MSQRKKIKYSNRNINKSIFPILNYKSIILILLMFLLMFFLFQLISSFNKPIIPLNVQQDSLFEHFIPNQGNFYNVEIKLNSDNVVNKISLYDAKNLIEYKVNTNLYTDYDKGYYQIGDLLNIIKQNRSENANSNYLYLLQNLFGINISNYIYTIDSNLYYSNNINLNWLDILKIKKYDTKLLNLFSTSIFNSQSISIYDKNQNDLIFQTVNNKYKSIKVEIYNSTDIQGYGTNASRVIANLGFGVVKVFNYDTTFPKSTLFIQNNDNNLSNIIKSSLNISQSKNTSPSNINSIADFIIILGGDTLNIF